jgi:glucuronoxylan 4-O-methyltransferase
LQNKIDYIQEIKNMKSLGKGLMSFNQYVEIAKVIDFIAPCNLLVFGLGHDSFLWNKINHSGKTYFLEDNEEWISEIQNGSLEVFHIKYGTRVELWEDVGFDGKKLFIDLPKEVLDTLWDCIIVDAPLGHQPPRKYAGPGRMSSIFYSSKLLKSGGMAVIDDMGREIEKRYAYHYFGKDNLVNLIENKLGIFKKV